MFTQEVKNRLHRELREMMGDDWVEGFEVEWKLVSNRLMHREVFQHDTPVDRINDRLSRCVSELYLLHAGTWEAANDMARWHAPHECYKDLSKSAQRKARRIVRDYGYTAAEVILEVDARLSPRAAYDLDVGCYLMDDQTWLALDEANAQRLKLMAEVGNA